MQLWPMPRGPKPCQHPHESACAVFIESVSMDADEGEAQELHRFLIHLPSACSYGWKGGDGAPILGMGGTPLACRPGLGRACRVGDIACCVALIVFKSSQHIPHPHHPADGQPIRSDRDKKAVYDVVKAQLLGSRLEVHPPSPPSGAGPGGKGGLRRVTSELHEVPSSLLRNLEDRWQFG